MCMHLETVQIAIFVHLEGIFVEENVKTREIFTGLRGLNLKPGDSSSPLFQKYFLNFDWVDFSYSMLNAPFL